MDIRNRIIKLEQVFASFPTLYQNRHKGDPNTYPTRRILLLRRLSEYTAFDPRNHKQLDRKHPAPTV
ncbi:hypothetical protein ACQXR1_19305 [Bacillus sp. ATD]|uniref:hypothetical protein n=1 Tax=Bacillus sp. ATD TaxID=3422305 RepID=UPI0014561C9E|nr:hypothetical protein [Bacillus subtilis]